MPQLHEHLQGRSKVQTLSRARIQPMGNGVQLTRGIAREIRAFRQVLAQQTIGVFIGPTLPGAVRVGRVDADGQPLQGAQTEGQWGDARATTLGSDRL